MYQWLAIAFLIFVIGGSAYYYYTSTQSTIASLLTDRATLQENVNTIQRANSENVRTITRIQELNNRNVENFNQLQNEFQVIRMQNRELAARFSRANIGEVAATSPNTVETVINNAVRNVNRCFELLSGSPLNEREREAKDGISFNSECPWMFDSLRGVVEPR
jgi:hypothetical protein